MSKSLSHILLVFPKAVFVLNKYFNCVKDKLNIGSKNEAGFIFNMSAGYNFEGIVKENVQWFFAKMNDASEELNIKINEIKEIYPNIVNLNINSCIYCFTCS